jgi:hypothetical protein
MPTIKQEIENIHCQMMDIYKGISFHYGRKFDINIQGDNKCFPAMILIEPDDIGFTVDMNNGNIKQYDTVFIQFVDIVPMAEQASDREDVVNSMRMVAADFVNRVINSKTLAVQSAGGIVNVRGTLIVDEYDVNVAGIEINLPLSLVYPEQVCLS